MSCNNKFFTGAQYWRPASAMDAQLESAATLGIRKAQSGALVSTLLWVLASSADLAPACSGKKLFFHLLFIPPIEHAFQKIFL